MVERMRRWWWVGVLAVVVIAGVVWLVWPEPAEPRAREYRDVTACLLTDEQGVAGPQAAPVWAGMQAASLQTSGQVRYLAVTGTQDVANAKTFVGTLVLGRCQVIVAPAGLPAKTVTAVAKQFPAQQFLLVGDGQSSGNVSAISASDPTAVRSAVTTDIAHRLQS
jgi:hypothetical protein